MSSHRLTVAPNGAPQLLRFRDLQAAGLVSTWSVLARRVERDGFPRGRMLTAYTRVWLASEIDAWLAARPVEGPPLRGAAKRNRARKSRNEKETARRG